MNLGLRHLVRANYNGRDLHDLGKRRQEARGQPTTPTPARFALNLSFVWTPASHLPPCACSKRGDVPGSPTLLGCHVSAWGRYRRIVQVQPLG